MEDERPPEKRWREWERISETYHRYVYWYFQALGVFLSAAVLAAVYAFLRGTNSFSLPTGVILFTFLLLVLGGHPFIHRYGVRLGNRLRALEDGLDFPKENRTGPILELITAGGVLVWTTVGAVAIIAAPGRLLDSPWWLWKPIVLVLVLLAPAIGFSIVERAWPLVDEVEIIGIQNLGRTGPEGP